MSVAVPGPDSRWRCSSCGNLTRFDVIRAVRSREFVHVSLAGEPETQEREVLSETVERVTCRWCGGVDTVVVESTPLRDSESADRRGSESADAHASDVGS